MAENYRVLVIDDEDIVHASIRKILTKLGYEVDAALTAREGLHAMEKNAYDAVITDLMMPEMNGIEMLNAMKERQINVPTIMVTGYPTIKTAIQALRLGAVDYIPKPFTRLELLSSLNRMLRRGAEGSVSVREGDAEIDQGQAGVEPGDRFFLPEHSWIVYNQDGTVDVGIENGFLSSIQGLDSMDVPGENDMVEQGYPGIRLRSGDEVHGVFMPLSGRVVAVNEGAVRNPGSLDSRTWVIKVIPSRLSEEIEWLRRRS